MKRLGGRKWGMVIGIACQFLILPLLGFCIAKTFDLDPLYGISLMVIMSSPGGSFSNWWCSLFNADLAMSVAMTGASVLVGVVMLPVNISFYCWMLYGDASFTMDRFVSIIGALVVIVVALIVGLSMSYFFDSAKAKDRFNVAGNMAGISLFVLSLFISGNHSTTPIWREPWWLHVVVAVPILGAIAMTVLLSSAPVLGLKRPERVAVVIEACYQNPALASSIVIGMFSGTDVGDAVAVPILYGIYEGILLAVFCVGAHYANWTFVSPSDVSLVQAIRGNYQNCSLAADADQSCNDQAPASSHSQTLVEICPDSSA